MTQNDLTAIELHNVSKTFGKSHGALLNINLCIAAGEFMVLVGPSGCGKSTLLRLIAGLDLPTAGDIYIEGKNALELSPQQRNIAMVFQNYALYPHMTIRKNLQFPLKMKKLSKVKIDEQTQFVVELLNLQGLLDRLPMQLSGGQKQRVAMGRALVRNPRLFLLDEPLSNLDAKLRNQIRSEIALVQKKLAITTIYVTHDQTEAMTLGDRVAVINHGRIQQIASPEALYRSPSNAFVANFIGNPGMNLILGTLINSNSKLAVSLAERKLFIDDGVSHLNPGNSNDFESKILIGFRPEVVKFDNGNNHFSVVIKAIEKLGHEMLVYFQFESPGIIITNGDYCVARTAPNPALKINTTISIQIHCQDFHYFSQDSNSPTKLL